MPLEIVTIPCLTDNYAYLAHDAATGTTAVIDVPEATPILNALAARGWKASHILITHHHDDHIAGVEALAAATGARVIGAAADAHRLPPLDEAVSEGDTVLLGMGMGHVIEVPGHTVGHIAFHFPDSAVVFTADSLMSCGCGRLFEGTPDQMWDSLSKLAALPEGTLVCSGHEYTQSNIRFALSVDPDNAALLDRAARVAALRARGEATVPVTLAEERATNPFLRATDQAMKARVGLEGASDTRVFAHLRALKDRF
ncbi:hydroxyacylglutathione hydrolase [Frigidibacter sp. RF13]|uniref:hydroxyacylglutathione hydrolase n=1 Tax=Frigidibacter sp. RF13 TaxID=2997340 RepID=UPI00226F423E|nr:hydroxyacylglutathione hydrolase [Frigidibacter sp. RF13]MCY1126115.1 hydroxyacylglutathione hydrolase [Frigidibacter sp. RF13]